MNSLGLHTDKAHQLTGRLNALLANYQMFYQNLRGFHWNIEGNSFFELHTKFEELYTQANLSVDEIAERILTLEGTPLHTFEDYISNSTIKAAKGLKTAQETVSTTVDNLSTPVATEREILDLAGAAGDEGTDSLMSDYIREKEKTIWMLRSYLGK